MDLKSGQVGNRNRSSKSAEEGSPVTRSSGSLVKNGADRWMDKSKVGHILWRSGPGPEPSLELAWTCWISAVKMSYRSHAI